MLVGEKYDAFLDNAADVEFLEGTTLAGKTTVGVYKFMLEVAESSKRQHIIAGLDTGTIEKNVINKEHGILDEWGVLVSYNGLGSKEEKLPHIIFAPQRGQEKIIYVLGYDDKKRWKKALGGQYGCIYIDELNIAHIDFVREAMMRCDYALGTLNPDDPRLPVYKEYVNCSRPLKRWEDDVPKEIMAELTEEPKSGWDYWFFSFADNIALTDEKLDKVKRNVPVGTKLWKNKILGLRGRATGLVFSNFERSRNVISAEWLKKQVAVRNIVFKKFTAALDTSYSQRSTDTFAMIFQGITDKGKCIVLEEEVLTNENKAKPLAPSDIAPKYIEFLDRCRQEWGLARNVFIDAADQATKTELLKHKRKYGSIYTFNDSYKGIKILDRIELMLGWIQMGYYQVCDHCTEHIRELETYSWLDDKDEPEDANDHTINASQYGWIPFKGEIGTGE